MALDITNKQAVQQFIDTDYKRAFGPTRTAIFDPTIDGDADYWTEQIMSGKLNPNDLAWHLDESFEATNNLQNDPGGVNWEESITSQYDTNPWLQNFGDIGSGATYESANKYGHATNQIQGISNAVGAALTAANAANNVDNSTNPYLNRVYNTVSDSDLGPGPGGEEEEVVIGGDDSETSTSWWDQYSDIDAFKDALGLGTQQSGGMDDFMKFMMFMSMMRPQGGMGGYGGSQYGYGGLNPGGVMSAYNPMDNIQSAIQAFQSIPGIGGGSGLNDGNAAAA